MRWRVVIVVWLLATAVAAGTVVRLASYNVRNYTVTDRITSEGWVPAYPKPESEKRALRGILLEVRPDVLALQEIGPEPFLRELQRDLRREGLHYPYAALLDGADEQRKLAVLSRLPLTGTYSRDDLRVRVNGAEMPHARGLLEVSFMTDGLRWSVVNLHLKSRRTERADDPNGVQQRTAEAQVVRDDLRRRYPPGGRDLFLIVGDLNDSPRSPAVRRLLEVNDTPLSVAIPAFDSRGETWTHNWRAEDLYQRVDYILASPTLAKALGPTTATIFDGPKWDEASDHRLLYLDLDFVEIGTSLAEDQ